MSWNKYDAVTYARSHAQAHSGGHCARAVARAIEAGGIHVRGADAMNFGHSLEEAGFQVVYGEPMEGDVAVINPLSGLHQFGHACIYDGMGTWYSDFVQRGMYPGSRYRNEKPAFTLYRHY